MHSLIFQLCAVMYARHNVDQRGFDSGRKWLDTLTTKYRKMGIQLRKLSRVVYGIEPCHRVSSSSHQQDISKRKSREILSSATKR